MSQSLRITVGALMLLPVVVAFLLSGFPAAAAKDKATPLADPGVHTRIDENVRQSCRSKTRGSVEHSICLAEARKNAWREAAQARTDDRKQPSLSLR
ncbi:hypothetical protein [Sphingosinicella soli]|uniref:Uncharacterized protein n=1 Tax=Sphingosinicella soli TaxID=333708 RepID=A0A7W7F611_9SPHN|nr:hypothetical protein [Sphingosinicella soli]MBB4631204.1 hypothetical protein [Sphingosinicella soli]